MKSKLLFGFAVVAAFAAVLLSGCGKETTTTTSNCTSFAVTDTGGHTIYSGTIPLPLSAIHDSLVGSVSGSVVTISSSALNRNLTGTIDASDCNKINLDSVIFPAGDTLKIATTLPIPGGFVKIWNIRAGGTGSIATDGKVTTQINVVKGNTNLSSPVDLSTITPALGLNLKGKFIKFL